MQVLWLYAPRQQCARLCVWRRGRCAPRSRSQPSIFFVGRRGRAGFGQRRRRRPGRHAPVGPGGRGNSAVPPPPGQEGRHDQGRVGGFCRDPPGQLGCWSTCHDQGTCPTRTYIGHPHAPPPHRHPQPAPPTPTTPPTTRDDHHHHQVKALQGLQALIPQRSAAALAAALQPWAYLHRRLVLDHSRAVRSEAAATLGCLVAALGKGLAPSLKQLMGPWWLAMHDPYGEAAATSRGALQVAG